MAERLLLIEDEEKLARMVELELRYEGYEVEKAFDGRTGLERALSGEHGLILLDIMLPALSGMEVLRRLRREDAAAFLGGSGEPADQGPGGGAVQTGGRGNTTSGARAAAVRMSLSEREKCFRSSLSTAF